MDPFVIFKADTGSPPLYPNTFPAAMAPRRKEMYLGPLSCGVVPLFDENVTVNKDNSTAILRYFRAAHDARHPADVGETIFLVLDGCSAHGTPAFRATAEAAKIELIFLPPNCTLFFQFLDCFYFGPFKSNWERVFNLYIRPALGGKLETDLTAEAQRLLVAAMVRHSHNAHFTSAGVHELNFRLFGLGTLRDGERIRAPALKTCSAFTEAQIQEVKAELVQLKEAGVPWKRAYLEFQMKDGSVEGLGTPYATKLQFGRTRREKMRRQTQAALKRLADDFATQRLLREVRAAAAAERVAAPLAASGAATAEGGAAAAAAAAVAAPAAAAPAAAVVAGGDAIEAPTDDEAAAGAGGEGAAMSEGAAAPVVAVPGRTGVEMGGRSAAVSGVRTRSMAGRGGAAAPPPAPPSKVARVARVSKAAAAQAVKAREEQRRWSLMLANADAARRLDWNVRTRLGDIVVFTVSNKRKAQGEPTPTTTRRSRARREPPMP